MWRIWQHGGTIKEHQDGRQDKTLKGFEKKEFCALFSFTEVLTVHSEWKSVCLYEKLGPFLARLVLGGPVSVPDHFFLFSIWNVGRSKHDDSIKNHKVFGGSKTSPKNCWWVFTFDFYSENLWFWFWSSSHLKTRTGPCVGTIPPHSPLLRTWSIFLSCRFRFVFYRVFYGK